MNTMNKYHKALLMIGCEHPAVYINREPTIVEMLFNRVTAEARQAVGAEGNDDDAKADWCEQQLDIEERS